jgi:uncharacterized protein DUF3160
MEMRRSLALLLLVASCSAPPTGRDLDGIVGLDKVVMSDEARALLARNGFVVCGRTIPDMSERYKASQPLPRFYTVDVVTEVVLADMEAAFLKLHLTSAERLKSLLELLWNERSKVAVPEAMRAAFDRLGAIIAVGRALADPGWELPKDTPLLNHARADLYAVVRGVQGGESKLWRRSVDWAVYVPEGPHAATAELKCAYRVMRWWTHQGFHVDDAEELLCAGLLAWLIDVTAGAQPLLRSLNASHELFLGPPDDIPIAALFDASDPDRAAFARELAQACEAAPPPMFDKAGDRRFGRTVRLLPVRRSFDAVLLQQVIHPNVPARWLPRGIDWIAAAGDDRARTHATADEPALQPLFENMSRPEPASAYQDALAEFCLAQARLQTGPGRPDFMRTDAWRDRGLAAALATWAGARELMAPLVHDSYERGFKDVPPSVIEPNLDAWRRLRDWALAAEDAFRRCDVQYDDRTRRLLIEKFLEMAQRQAQGGKLTDEEEWQLITDYYLMLQHPGEDESGFVDRRTCTPFARQDTAHKRLVRRAGKAGARLYVILPHAGRPHLYQGAVFDYVEFDESPGRPVTRAEFRRLMDGPDAPAPPSWTRSYRARP